ncbi:MAG: hypothetical protein KF901_14610 [Myxococcales bacterium]|nr:hypothetical protein [Myxococcales bacterium]
MRELMVWVALFLLLEGVHAVPIDAASGGDARLVGDDPNAYASTLNAELTFENPRSPSGWGSLDLSASPQRDEVRVDVVLGTPTVARRFTCGTLAVVIDGAGESVSASEVGTPMSGGHFDAVTARLTIDHVRRMVSARDVALEVCGERFDLRATDRTRLEDFVRRFDDLATNDGPSLPFPPPELGPEHEWPIHDPAFFGGPPTPS